MPSQRTGEGDRPASRGGDAAARPAEDLRATLIAILPDLRGFARFLARDPEEARDLVQDTVVRVLSALHQFQPGTSFRAWTFTILRNAFYTSRRRKRPADIHLDDPEAQAQLGTAPPQEMRLAVRDLNRALREISPLHREALALVSAAGLSYEEAAAVCGCRVGTIKSRVSRARALLAVRLGRPGGPE
ncbi:MAG: sigma-70 family RNA polymerase sigma factor [Alphaproteobacteria bacterium]|nr:sigma-70 family RNA polymerase sigma factor [Alphaproteobacteria bacterium]